MTRTLLTMLAVAAIPGLATGCSISGEWKRIATDPPQAMFPVDRLTLDNDHRYTSRWEQKGRKLASTGTYQYQRGKLSVAEYGRAPRDYGAHVRLDGKLELTYTVNGETITALLERNTKPKPVSKKEPEKGPSEPSGPNSEPSTREK